MEETEQLLKLGLAENPTASQALGYKQTIEYLRGVRSLSETIELVKIRTRQYAKRQVTWFRHQHRFCWIPVQSEDPADQIAQNVTDRLNSLAS